MKTLFRILLFFTICTFVSCSDDEMEIQEIVDMEGPNFNRVSWIDNPAITNDPTGEILDGSNHRISIESGFHLLIDVVDESEIIQGEIYFTINNDPEIKEIIFSPDLIIESNQSGIGFVYRVNKIWLGPDEWYELQPGDTYQFFARFTDEFANESSMTWTADIVE